MIPKFNDTSATTDIADVFKGSSRPYDMLRLLDNVPSIFVTDKPF